MNSFWKSLGSCCLSVSPSCEYGSEIWDFLDKPHVVVASEMHQAINYGLFSCQQPRIKLLFGMLVCRQEKKPVCCLPSQQTTVCLKSGNLQFSSSSAKGWGSIYAQRLRKLICMFVNGLKWSHTIWVHTCDAIIVMSTLEPDLLL